MSSYRAENMLIMYTITNLCSWSCKKPFSHLRISKPCCAYKLNSPLWFELIAIVMSTIPLSSCLFSMAGFSTNVFSLTRHTMTRSTASTPAVVRTTSMNVTSSMTTSLCQSLWLQQQRSSKTWIKEMWPHIYLRALTTLLWKGTRDRWMNQIYNMWTIPYSCFAFPNWLKSTLNWILNNFNVPISKVLCNTDVFIFCMLVYVPFVGTAVWSIPTRVMQATFPWRPRSGTTTRVTTRCPHSSTPTPTACSGPSWTRRGLLDTSLVRWMVLSLDILWKKI